jgi:sec-independent protein translocase protein TatC
MPPESPSEEYESPLLGALERVRWRIIRTLAALFIGAIVGFLLVHYGGLTEILVRPIRPFLEHQDGRLAALSPMTGFMLELKVALVIAFILALPVLLHQVWGHFSPLLLEQERRLMLPSLLASVVLFSAGVVVGYLVLPISLGWLFGFQEDYVRAVISADEYFSFAVRMLFAFGLVFEMPIVILILTTLGIVTPQFLRDKRRHAIVGITVLSSLVTPGDVISTFLMMAPMILFYEVSIYISALMARRREEQLEAARPESVEASSEEVGTGAD